MLGLGNSMGSASAGPLFTPMDISNLVVWLNFGSNITSDVNASSVSVDHRTAFSNMVDADKINAWNAHGTTSINAVQTTDADKPLWETDAADLGGIKFQTSKWLDFSSSIVFDVNTDFTIAIRLKCTNYSVARGFLGSHSTELIKFVDNDTVRVKIDNTNRDFDLASGTFATDKYITLIIVRSDGSTGNINVYGRGVDSGYFDGTATGTQIGSQIADATEITVTDLGTAVDDAQNFAGIIKDVIIYDGTAVDSAQREQLFDHIESNIQSN